jgi:hypothetical protein
VASQEVLGEGLRALQPRRCLPRPEAPQSAALESVDDARDQRRLRSHDREIDTLRASKLDHAPDVGGLDGDVADFGLARRAGIARGDQHFGDPSRCRALPGQGMLPAAGADDQDFHQ